MKYSTGILLFFLSLTVYATAPVAFDEVWAYLMAGEERFLATNAPISDIGYFGAGLNNFGHLVGVPDRSKLNGWNGRVHLVVAEVSNPALSHFCLNPEYGIRSRLIQSIVDASRDFDGVQIDFEQVASRDRDHFLTFLAAIKASIGAKTLSVALPARTRKIDDAYDYEAVSRIADRVIVMAYDEHWSGGKPGPIATIAWCERVSAWAHSTIGMDKLVMGLPFYGRAWADANPARAYRYSALENLIREKGIAEINRTADIPWFQYRETVTVTVYFEDERSLSARARMYHDADVRRIAFWRLGQEDSQIWSFLSLR